MNAQKEKLMNPKKIRENPKLLPQLQYIEKVEKSNQTMIGLELNDNHYLLVEGSFTLYTSQQKIVDSKTYTDSNFSPTILQKIQSLLEKQPLKSAYFSEDDGTLVLELSNGLCFSSFYGENDYESWELMQNGNAQYGSECGTIIHYLL